MTQTYPLPIVTTVAALREAVAGWRRDRAAVALVPTMGALHEGHLALVREARARATRVVVSIFVNPAQFAPHEDFARYPRDLVRDGQLLADAGGVDLIYAPEMGEMYPDGFATRIAMDGPARGLESDFRPHFFSGVATVVTKLLLQCRPDFAMFGEKDYQQLLVVKRLVKDLDLPVEIVGVPTVRASDGLALSSRNAYLSAEARGLAARLNAVLHEVAGHAAAGTLLPKAEAEGIAALLAAGFERIDYLAIRDAGTLMPVGRFAQPARVLAAARLGGVRLIDNVAA